ncbi:MAG: AAA family ATPase, partial [Clostridia bacterium]|nr:AAA family ATPase [Clostridia bacterium]
MALVIATTREDLEGQAARGAFLPDLYRFFRETVILPPLRDYREDLPGLVAHLLERFSRETGKKVAGVSAETLTLLCGYSWPGNVRELANVLERAVILAEEGKLITPQQVFLPRKEWEEEGEILPLKEARRLMVARALARYGGTVEGKKKAARALG